MLNARFIVGTAVAVLGFASFVSAETRLVYVGGHEPVRQFRVDQVQQTNAPYALTGSDMTTSAPTRSVPIRVDSRIVGMQISR